MTVLVLNDLAIQVLLQRLCLFFLPRYKKVMIGCEISGGLGNQFFRYAIARRILKERKSKGIEDRLVINGGHLDAHGVSGNLFDFQIYKHEKCNVRRMELAYGTVLQKFVFLAYTFVYRCLNRVAPHFEKNRRTLENNIGSMWHD